jgi:hypothetical protein
MGKYMAENRDPRHWHLNKEVSITHIFSTISAIFVAAVFLSKQETRISLVEKEVGMQRAEVVELKSAVRDDLKNIHTDIKDVGAKVDRLFERKR